MESIPATFLVYGRAHGKWHYNETIVERIDPRLFLLSSLPQTIKASDPLERRKNCPIDNKGVVKVVKNRVKESRARIGGIAK